MRTDHALLCHVFSSLFQVMGSLTPVRRQVITRNYVALLSVENVMTNFNEIMIFVQTWSFKNEFEIVICKITAILYNLRHAIHNLLENHYYDIQIENGGPFLTPVLISPACIKVLSTFGLIAHCETFVTFLPKWCKLGTPLTSHGPDQTRVEWSLHALPVAFELPRDIPPRPNPYLW